MANGSAKRRRRSPATLTPSMRSEERRHQALDFASYKGNLQIKSIRLDKAKRDGDANPA